MNIFLNCLLKDFYEFKREKRQILFFVIVFLLGVFVLSITLLMPYLLNTLIEKNGSVLEYKRIFDMINTLFPNDLKGSLKIFSSDVGVFYSIIVIFISSGLIPSEIKSGKWLLPLSCGYKPTLLLTSKVVINGLFSGLPCFVLYMLYYFIESQFLQCNFAFENAVLNAFSLAFSICAIASISILSSAIIKNKFITIISLITVVIGIPDVMSLFYFGKYLPTHLLTFAYNSSENIMELVIPVIFTIIIVLSMYVVAIKKAKKLHLDR